MACASDIFLCLLAILFPPLPGKLTLPFRYPLVSIQYIDTNMPQVWVKRGLCSADSLINIALCMLGGVPGLIHAWYIIFKYPDPYEEYSHVGGGGGGGDPEGGAVTYYYVRHRPSSEGVRQQYHHHQSPPPPRHQSYGTTSAPASASMPPVPEDEQHQVAGQPGGAGPAAGDGVPPTYEQAVKGDHKIQSDH